MTSSLRLVLRLGVVAFFSVTSVYAALNCSPFAFDMFVKPLLLPWLGSFVAWHHLWFCAAYALSLGTLPWQLLRSTAARSPREQAAYGLTVAFVVLFGVAAVAIVLSPLLPTLWKGDRALPIALGALLPLVMLAGIDLLVAPPAVWAGAARATTDQRRVLMAFSASVVYLWGIHFLHAVSQADGGGALAWALTGARALLLTAAVFAVAYPAALLMTGIAARTRAPRAAEIALTAGALGFGLSEFLRRAVLPTISLDGWTSVVFSATVGLTVAATWTGLAVRRPLDAATDEWSGVDVMLVPRLGRPAMALGLVMVPVLALVALREIERIDWNFVMRRTMLGVEGLVVVALMLRATASVRGGAMSWRGVVVPPVLVLAMFMGLTPLASRLAAWSGDPSLEPAVAFERHATAEGAFRELTELLIDRPGVDADYYAFLHDHADFSGRTSVRMPEVDLVAPTAPAAHVTGRQPDIFVFVVDSLRRDYLSPYNDAVTFTPNIAAFAADSFAFDNAFTRHGGTELAITSIWAGAAVTRKARTHGLSRMNAIEKLVNADRYRIAINDFTVAEQLLETTPVTTIDQGVPSAETDLCSNLDGLERYLDGSHADPRPVFGFFAPMNVHIVNTRNGGQTSLDGDYPGFYAPYASRLRRIDACFGRFMSYLKQRDRYDDSIIVLTSDHGDSLGENGFWGHAMYLFPEDVRVPLIVHVPERVKPLMTTDLTRLAFSTDLAPTFYALLGHPVSAPAAHFGEPLFVPSEGSLSDRRRRSYLLTSSYGPTYALLRRNGRLLYVSDLLEWREFAYDLSDGPIGVPVAIDAELRSINQRAIRQQVVDLSAFYGFSR